MECERTCELSFLPLRPGELDEEDMDELKKQGIINAEGEASTRGENKGKSKSRFSAEIEYGQPST